MRKTLLLSIALVLCISLVAIGAVGNSKLSLTAKSTPKPLANTSASAPVKAAAIKAPAPIGQFSSAPVSMKTSIWTTAAQKPADATPAKDKGKEVVPPADRNLILQGGDNFASATPITSNTYSDAGTTTGYVHDYTGSCLYSSAPDVVYSYVTTQDGVMTASLCGSSFDTGMIIFMDNSSTQVGCNDDSQCGLQSEIADLPVTAGHTYYIVVTGYSSYNGPYTFNFEFGGPCTVTCPNGATPENEPTCYDEYVDVTNGGCNSAPNVYGTVSLGETICGNAGTFLLGGNQNRDTDWYTLTIGQDTSVVITGAAQFLLNMYILNNDCANIVLLASGSSNPCDTLTMSATLVAGEYRVFAAPGVFDGVPCGSPYWFTVTGAVPTPAPWNDHCEDVTPSLLTDGGFLTFNGTVDGATSDGDCSSFPGYPLVYEGFYTEEPLNITVDYCGTSPAWGNIWINLAIDCPCTGFTPFVSYSNSECGDGNYSIHYSLGPGTYYVPVMWDPSYNSGTDYTIHVTGAASQIPANDLCADAIPVAIPSSTDGTTIDATLDTAPTCFYTITAPGVWYTVVGNGDSLSADVCSATWDTKMHVFCGSCENLVCVYGNDDACGTGLQSLVSWASVAGNTYYILVDGFSSSTGPFTLNVNDLGPYYGTPVDCNPPPPEADFVVTAPGQWTDGNLCGAGDNCNLRAGEDQIWQITIPQDGDWTFAFCNSPNAWDTYIYLGTTLCGQEIGYQDDGCSGTFLSKATWTLTAGTYYLDVEAYSPGDCDVYTLDVTMQEPCVLTCPDGATPENEPTCYDYYVDVTNGGCNSDPYVYGTVSLGETICGNAGTYVADAGDSRDTDWYTLTIGQDTSVVITGAAQFLFNMYLLNNDCANIVVLASGSSSACDTLSMTASLTAGEYRVFAAPGTFTGVPCGSPYWFTVTAVTPPPPPHDPCVDPNAVYGQPNDISGALASQCDVVYPFTAATADDFILPGSGNVNIGEVGAYVYFWNGAGGENPDNFDAVQVIFYADNSGVPGGQPADDGTCDHIDNMGGAGIIATYSFLPGEFSWQVTDLGNYQLALPLDPPVTLTAGTTYWLEVQPQMGFSASGQVGWSPTSLVTGAIAQQGFPLLGIPYWGPNSNAQDVAFCLVQAGGGGLCDYTPGDINGNGTPNGIDVVFGVNYFKGIGVPPIDCHPICTAEPNPFYAAGDVNGNCVFNGIDITFFVRYLKGQVPNLLFCADCPPAPIAAPAVIQKAVKTTNQQ